MKRKGTKNLTRTQRLMLEDCVNAGLSKKVIAEKLGVKYLSKRTLVAAPDIYRCAMNDLLGLNKK